MHWFYGDFRHDDGEVQVSLVKTPEVAQTGEPFGIRWRFDLQGVLIRSTQAALHQRIGEMQAAYAFENQDCGLRFSNGSLTHIILNADACIGGLRVTSPPSFPSNEDGAYGRYIAYSISLEGIVARTVSTDTLSFRETVEFSGGGAVRDMMEPLNAPPVDVLLRSHSAYRAVQSGEAVGLYSYPVVPRALWPRALNKTPDISRSSPTRKGFGANITYTDYPVSWRYEFSSKTPLTGSPNAWA